MNSFLQTVARWIAQGFGSGLSPVAPGTLGTLWAWVFWIFVLERLSPAALGIVLLLSLFIGWWACQRTAALLGSEDPSSIVWDEILAFWCVLALLAPANFSTQLWAFVWFRFFDAVKPGPVAWADRVFKGTGWRGAWGILFDDFVAAFCTLLVFALWRSF